MRAVTQVEPALLETPALEGKFCIGMLEISVRMAERSIGRQNPVVFARILESFVDDELPVDGPRVSKHYRLFEAILDLGGRREHYWRKMVFSFHVNGPCQVCGESRVVCDHVRWTFLRDRLWRHRETDHLFRRYCLDTDLSIIPKQSAYRDPVPTVMLGKLLLHCYPTPPKAGAAGLLLCSACQLDVLKRVVPKIPQFERRLCWSHLLSAEHPKTELASA